MKHNKKRNILIITPGGLPVPATDGGAVQNLIESIIKENNDRLECNITIISPYDQHAYEKSKLYSSTNFKWVKIPSFITTLDNLVLKFVKKVFKNKKIISARSIFKYIYFTYSCGVILKNNSYSDVIIENSVILFWAIRLFGNVNKYGDRYYFHLHNVPRISAGCKSIIKKSKKVLCVSNYVANQITKQDSSIGEISKDNIEIFYNCIDTNKFKPIDDIKILNVYRDKFGINYDEKVIVFSGRLSREKGIEELLKSIKFLKINNYKLLIVGSCFYNLKINTDFEKELIKLSLPFKDKIIFTGYVKYDEMEYIYNLADVVVLPSMWEEPAGLTIIEAMACGKVVITTKSGGICEYTGDNNCILLDKCEGIERLIAENIDNLFRSEELMQIYGQRALNKAKEYNTRAYIERFYDILDIRNKETL